MTEALYTHSTYHNVYDSRQEMQTLWSRMGTAWRQDPGNVPEMQIPLLEQRTTEVKEVMPAPKDPVKNAEWRKKLSEAGRGHVVSEETRSKISEAKKGIPKSKEHREKLAAALRGRPLPEGTKIKISEAMKGRTRSPEHCKHISEAKMGEKHPMFGKHLSPEHRRKVGDAHRGEKCRWWQGGISFEPYCQKFNNEFKERVRAFFGYRCVECGTPQNGKKLDVHHVNFNKKTCCDDSVPLFVPLCHHCHTVTTRGDRQFWEQHFTEMIDQYYGGKCYFTKEEMKQYRQAKV